MIVLLSYISFDFREPTIYSYHHRRIYSNFQGMFISLSYSSEQVNKSQNNELTIDSLNFNTDILLRKLGGFNFVSGGLKVGNFFVVLGYFANEGLGIKAFDRAIISAGKEFYGSVQDTIYPNEIDGLNRSIIVNYSINANPGRLDLKTEGEWKYMSNPIILTLGKGNAFLNFKYRKFSGTGRITFNANLITMENPANVQPMDSRVKWYGRLLVLPKSPPNFRNMKYEITLKDVNHISFDFNYVWNNFLFMVGYSPQLNVNGTLRQKSRITLNIKDTAKTMYLSEDNQLYAVIYGDTIEISGSGILYAEFDYTDDSTYEESSINYSIPSNITWGISYTKEFGKFGLSLFAFGLDLNRLNVGFIGSYKLNERYKFEYGSSYISNPFLNYISLETKFGIITKSVDISFGIVSMLPLNSFDFVRNNFPFFENVKDTEDFFFSMNFELSFFTE